MPVREVVVQSKSVKEACLKARDLLRKDETIIHTEILEQGRRGFCGFLKRPAVIKVTIREKGSDLIKGSDHLVNGAAEVSGGAVRVYSPKAGGKKAVIIPTAGVNLKVNGVLIRESSQVGDEQEIEVELVKEIEEAKIDVKISDEALRAEVKITPEITTTFKLVDQDKQNVLQLLTVKHVEKKKIITAEQVMEALKARGVTFGLSPDLVEEATAAADGKWRLAARGTAVAQGKDGYVEYLFQHAPVEIKYGDEEPANFWERYILPGVREGDIIAVLHPPEKGLPGKTVTGKDILPRPVKEDFLRVKDGVMLSDDGRKAIATAFGRPVVEGLRKKYIKIVPLMVHPGNVDIVSGNLRYDGDLMILGNISEGMEVFAHGDITIMGDAINAKVHAGGKVSCSGKMIGTTVRAGGLLPLYSRITRLLKELRETLDWIKMEIDEVCKQSQPRLVLDSNNLNRITVLLKSRVKSELDDLVRNYCLIIEIEDIPFPGAFSELVKELKAFISTSVKYDSSKHEQVGKIVEMIDNLFEILSAYPEQVFDIYCCYAQNSILEASGNVVVSGQGCYQSSLTAGKNIRVNGIVRGGEISADGDIFINEAGTRASKVHIKVPDKASVSFNQVYPDTVVHIGSEKYYFEENMTQKKVFLGADGAIRIKNLEKG